MNHWKKVLTTGIVFLLFVSLGCGKSSSSTNTDLTQAAAIVGAGDATANGGSSAARLFLFEPRSLWAWLIAENLVVADSAPPAVKTIGKIITTLRANITADPKTVAASLVNPLTENNFRAPCYGPSLSENSTGSVVNRPANDLGMWVPTASPTDSRACSVGELEALTQNGGPGVLNNITGVQTAMLSGMNAKGMGLPSVGATTDATSAMPTISGVTITSATLSRLSNNADGSPNYKTTLSFNGGTATIWHSPQNSDNTVFQGLIQVMHPHQPAGNRGISMVYQQTSDGTLTIVMETAANRGTISTDFFGSNGRIDFTKPSFGQDGNKMIAQFNPNTHLGIMHFAWQAGNMDGAVRAFHVGVPAGTDGSLTAVAYFGFGAAITSLPDATSTLWASKMFCNWVQGLGNGVSVANVQGQTAAQDSTGKFIPVISHINFAPTNTCSSGTFAVTNAQPSNYNNASQSGTADLTTPNGALGTVSAVPVPTYVPPAS